MERSSSESINRLGQRGCPGKSWKGGDKAYCVEASWGSEQGQNSAIPGATIRGTSMIS